MAIITKIFPLITIKSLDLRFIEDVNKLSA